MVFFNGSLILNSNEHKSTFEIYQSKKSKTKLIKLTTFDIQLIGGHFMTNKVSKIRDLKTKENNEVNSSDEIVEDIEKINQQRIEELKNMMSDERRKEVVNKIDQFLVKENLDIYEAMLAFSDLFGSLFSSVITNEQDDNENEATIYRINSVRQKIVECLNNRESGQSLAEDTVALLSLVNEGVIVGLKQDLVIAEKQANEVR